MWERYVIFLINIFSYEVHIMYIQNFLWEVEFWVGTIIRSDLFYAVFKMLISLEIFNIFRWPNPVLVSIERVNAARTVNVWIGRGFFWPNFFIDPILVSWNEV